MNNASSLSDDPYTALLNALDNLREITQITFNEQILCEKTVAMYGSITHPHLSGHLQLSEKYQAQQKTLFPKIAQGINQLREALNSASDSEDSKVANLFIFCDNFLEELWDQESFRPLFDHANEVYQNAEVTPDIDETEQIRVGMAAHHFCNRFMAEMYDGMSRTYANYQTTQRRSTDLQERLEKYSVAKLLDEARDFIK